MAKVSQIITSWDEFGCVKFDFGCFYVREVNGLDVDKTERFAIGKDGVEIVLSRKQILDSSLLTAIQSIAYAGEIGGRKAGDEYINNMMRTK